MPKSIAVATWFGNSLCYRKRGYTSGMSRKLKLRELIQSRADGCQADFARMVGRTPAVIWQYASGHREMGEKLARHIERKLSLPVGWMDATTESEREAPRPCALSAMLCRVVSRISEDGECAVDDAMSLIDLFLRETDPERRAKLGRILDDLSQSADRTSPKSSPAKQARTPL